MFAISIIENYDKILNYFLEQCSHFTVAYPGEKNIFDPSNPLMFKKDCFLKLSEITVSPWEDMTESISISGVLTSEVKEIFWDSLSQKGLWNYKLYREGVPVLSVSDFDVGVIDIPSDEINVLIRKKIISFDDYL